MGSIPDFFSPDNWWIKAKGTLWLRVCVGEIDDYGLPTPIFKSMTYDNFEDITGRKVEDEPVYEG